MEIISSASRQSFELQPIGRSVPPSSGENAHQCSICLGEIDLETVEAKRPEELAQTTHLNDIQPMDVVQTACGHDFHLACISSWTTKGSGENTMNCPVCTTPNNELLVQLQRINPGITPIAHPERLLVRDSGRNSNQPVPLAHLNADLERGIAFSRSAQHQHAHRATLRAYAFNPQEMNPQLRKTIVVLGLGGVAGLWIYAVNQIPSA